MILPDKKSIRKFVFTERGNYSYEQLVTPSRAVFEKLCKRPAYLNSERIYCYMDFRNEVQTIEFIKRAWNDGKKIAVPRVNGKLMDFFEISDFSSIKEGYFGIPEPDKEIPVFWPDALMIVPGVAFDKQMHRVGYGQGFYDRFLENYPNIYKIAVAFDFQVLDSVPYESTDILMDELITETKLYQKH